MHETSGNIIDELDVAPTGSDQPASGHVRIPMTDTTPHQDQPSEVHLDIEDMTTLPELTELTLLPDPE